MWAWDRLRYGRADRWAYVLVQINATDGEESAMAAIAGSPRWHGANFPKIGGEITTREKA